MIAVIHFSGKVLLEFQGFLIDQLLRLCFGPNGCCLLIIFDRGYLGRGTKPFPTELRL